MDQNTLVLVDGSSYLYRAFHALPPLTNSKGQPTGAVYGVVNMLRKLQKDYPTPYLAVIFDAKGKTFRDELYEEYKSNRPAMPDDLQLQIEPLHAIVQAMGLPLIMIEGVEADDIIGTLAHQAEAAGMKTVISTGDKDMAQLVNDKITLVNTMTNTVYDEKGVFNKFAVAPKQIIDYLTLVGDTSDNIPGVPNVGPKTAAKWLTQYQSLDNIITNANEITGKVGENLRNTIPQLPLIRELVTIKKDVPLPLKIADLKQTEPQKANLISWFKNLEFKTWLNELLAAPQTSATEVSTEQKKNHLIIFTETELTQWLAKLKQSEYFVVDVETTDPMSLTADIVGMAFAVQPHDAVYIPLAHDYVGVSPQLKTELVLQKLKAILEDPQHKKLGHNLKYDISVLANHGINLQGVVYDTMLESYVFDSTGSKHDLDSLALKYLGHRTIHFEDIAGKGAKQLSFQQIPIESAGAYAMENADITIQLHQNFWPKITAEKGLYDTFTQIEMPLATVLAHMERYGVLIDAKLLKHQSQEITQRLAELEEQAYKAAGKMFNLGSPKQLQEILYDQLGLPILEKTPTGQPSTAEPVLQELAENFELPKLILEHRGLSKLKSTYTDKLPEQINPRTGRVHTSYQQAVASTGRLSSTDPNLQNIPIRNEEGRRIRQAFIAPKGYKIIAADYSQIELRIMAHIAEDQTLLNAFANNLDIHAVTAAEVFNVPIEQVTANHRRDAKAINFGLIYGMSAFGLAKAIGTDRQAAQEYMDRYFQRYPNVKKYMENTRKNAHAKGYVETLIGRRLILPEINTRNMQRQKAAERAAINAPLQGTAADIIKSAMINIDKALAEAKLDAHMIMQVHDELVFEVAEKDVEALKVLILQHMQSAAALKVHLVVGIGIGNNWDEAH